MSSDELYNELEEKIKQSGHDMDIGRIRAAYDLAKDAHAAQVRRDGSPYVTHCIAAADICFDMGLDEDSIISALLHDTLEDTDITHEYLTKNFGAAVADIVEGVTKLSRVQYTSKEDEQMENLRKMLMAMSKDIRVILIKIADRLHNMRTMDFQSPEKQRSKSLETMEIYAPIAHRLGMQRAKWELEDLSLKYLDNQGYNEILSELNEKMPVLEKFMKAMEQKIKARLEEGGIHAAVQSRIKHVYSIYRKMYAQKSDLTGIFDLCAFRIIVDTIPDCYNVLGIIHEMFNPVPGRFKDYISTPKPNMYQSVHTTVIGSEGIPFEVQIRTWDMHHTAEYGIAAHWKYKLNDGGNSVREGDEDKFAWVRRLLESQQDTDAQDFFHNLKIDMFSDDVYVFSPKGDVVTLPVGATPIDFAYMIHSDIGNSMVGAKVNGRIVTYDHTLQNGDIVEIRTSKAAPGPSRDWLNIAASGSARTKIKQWFKKERREENIIRGREMLEDELKHEGIPIDDAIQSPVISPILKRLSFNSLEDCYAAIGYGGIAVARIVNKIQDELKALNAEKKTALDKVSAAAERREQNARKRTNSIHGILVEGLDNFLVKFSRCCTPVPGDDISGFITRGQGVSIHRKDCENYRNSINGPDSGRWITVSWADNITESYLTSVIIVSKDRGGLVLDIASVLASINAKVRSLVAKDTPTGLGIITVALEVHNLADLKYIISRLQAIPGIISIERNGTTAGRSASAETGASSLEAPVSGVRSGTGGKYEEDK